MNWKLLIAAEQAKTYCDKWNRFHGNQVSISFSLRLWLHTDSPKENH